MTLADGAMANRQIADYLIVTPSRLLVALVGLQGRWAQHDWGGEQTPALGINRRHGLTETF